MNGQDWTKARIGTAGDCHYGCGMPATMTEPGKPRKAHKVCAEESAGYVAAVITPAGESGAVKAEPRPLGCGTPAPGQTSGWSCGGTGDVLCCQVCPNSPGYWRNDLPAEVRAALPSEPERTVR